MEEYSIGQMAKMNCVSEKTLRVYQERGILEPARVDEKGYRYYTLEQCPTLDMIQELQQIGCSLEQIRSILEHKNVDDLRTVLLQQKEKIDDEMNHLRIAKHITRDFLATCDIYLDKPVLNEIILASLPVRRIITFENTSADGLSLPSGYESLRNWEFCLREVKRQIVQHGYPISLFRNVGCIIPLNRLVERRLVFEKSFVFVDGEFGKLYREARELPGGTFLTMYCDNIIMPDGRETEVVELARMLDYAQENGYRICGDYVGEVIADTPAFLYEGRNMLFKLCLPVKKTL